MAENNDRKPSSTHAGITICHTEVAFWVDVLVDIYVWADFGLSVRTAHWGRDSMLVVDTADIRKNYLKVG
jgi:hypothetical protein